MLLINIKQQDLLPDSIAFFTGVYMICLILPSACQLTLVGQLQVRAKLSAFDYQNKKEEKVIVTLKD